MSLSKDPDPSDEISNGFHDLNLEARSRPKDSSTVMLEKIDTKYKTKEKILRDEREQRLKRESKKTKQLEKWETKTQKSPFRVDLLAEQERIDEEHKMRLREESKRQKMLVKRKEKVKNDIILQALQQEADLDTLRREKRAIQMEEKRLKALYDLEKTNAHRKQDLLAAQRAERQRKQDKEEYRRVQNREKLEKERDQYTKFLAEKLDLEQNTKMMENYSV